MERVVLLPRKATGVAIQSEDKTFEVCLLSAEVDEQADLDSSGFQFVQQLGFVSGVQSRADFEFDEYAVVHEDIRAVLADKTTFVAHEDLGLDVSV